MGRIKYAVLDIEATGLNRYKDKVTYIGVGLAEDVGQPLTKIYILNMFKPDDVAKFKSIVVKLRERKVKLIWANGKFDTLFLDLKYGIMLPIHHDVMLMGTAYDLVARHKLKDMAVRYLGSDNWDIPLKEKVKPNNPVVEKYLKKDISEPWELFCYFSENMTDKQWMVYTKLLRPAYLMYRRTEKTGIYIDPVGLEKVKKQYKEEQEKRLKELKKIHDINWNSPAQVSNALFKDSNYGPALPIIKRSGKTGLPSADAKVLKRLASKGHDLPQKLLDYKFYYGANTKFLNKWGIYASYDGRIHPNFGLTNVQTGRTSCSDPNLQQVPRNKELRTLYTTKPGRVLMEADYSQIELRIAADYSNDPTMIKVYRTGGDIHTETATTMTPNPSKEDRSRAKAVNFGE